LNETDEPGDQRPRRSPVRLILGGIVALATIAYPFLVYYGLTRDLIRPLALILLIIFGLRLALMRGMSGPTLRGLLPAAIAALIIFALVLFRGEGAYFLFYPVIINATMLGAFGYTLLRPPSMIERLARLRRAELPRAAIGYCRVVTMVWCGFFLINGAIACWTALAASTETWTLYNGLISYLAMGVLFGVELIVRARFERRHAEQTREP